ncbi:MAG: DUF1015 domain-containing protein [Proteobacteria bacterium]|nr:DUF1015 domain-containing protein [Pseudomonadota bacterium]
MSETNIKPFKGMLFNKKKTGDIASCVCPPYDVISNAGTYYERNRFNAIRLELPEQHPPLDKYNTAKETLENWLQQGILTFDNKDTVYIYEQEFEVEHKSFLRRGFIALNKIEKNRMLTHEETRKKAKEDRERLISSLKTCTSFVFGLYEDNMQDIENILTAAAKEIVYDFIDEQSVTNRFYKMTDRDAINVLSKEMDKKSIYIADGHHRLDVSYRLGLSYIPIYLTNMYSDGVVILPYHRLVKYKHIKNINQILDSVKQYAEIEKIPLENDSSLSIALEYIAHSVGPAYLLYSKDAPNALYMLRISNSIPMDDKMHDSLKRLKVNILHNGILKGLLNISDDEISFTQESYESISIVKKGDFDLALFLPPTTVEEVKDIADHSLYMPPKSTFFYPKILTGLIFYKYE